MFDDFQEIFSTLRKNKLRTFLTGFSMAWGIFMLIVLLGAGNGLRNGILFNFADMATNFVKLWPGRTSEAYQGLQAGRRIKLDSTEGPYLENEFKQVSNISPRSPDPIRISSTREIMRPVYCKVSCRTTVVLKP